MAGVARCRCRRLQHAPGIVSRAEAPWARTLTDRRNIVNLDKDTRMPFVDVRDGARDVAWYRPNPASADLWQGWELRAEHRVTWNLVWQRAPDGTCVVKLVRASDVRLPEGVDWDSTSGPIARYTN